MTKPENIIAIDRLPEPRLTGLQSAFTSAMGANGSPYSLSEQSRLTFQIPGQVYWSDTLKDLPEALTLVEGKGKIYFSPDLTPETIAAVVPGNILLAAALGQGVKISQPEYPVSGYLPSGDQELIEPTLLEDLDECVVVGGFAVFNQPLLQYLKWMAIPNRETGGH